MFTCSALQITLHHSPASCLTYDASLCTCTVFSIHNVSYITVYTVEARRQSALAFRSVRYELYADVVCTGHDAVACLGTTQPTQLRPPAERDFYRGGGGGGGSQGATATPKMTLATPLPNQKEFIIIILFYKLTRILTKHYIKNKYNKGV